MILDNSALFVENLNLTNFRNYESTSINIGQNSVIITGNNGAGKTNILEAISLLTPGSGIRRATTKDFIKQNSDGIWGISSECNTMVGKTSIGTGFNEKNPNRRAVKINGVFTNQNTLSDYLSCVFLTPQMDRLWIENPSNRRKFIDRIIFGYDPAHSGRISAYEKSLRNRSNALKNGIDDNMWLSAMEKDIANRGVAIASSRMNIIERLNEFISKPLKPFPSSILKCDGVIENWLSNFSASDTEDKFIQHLKSSRPQDTITGGAEIGVHKSDIIATNLEKNISANLCSTGEQKSLLIRIILGNLQMQKLDTGLMPILLLDEVCAHLDNEKLTALFENITELNPQVWYTATEYKKFAEINKNLLHFHIEKNIVNSHT